MSSQRVSFPNGRGQQLAAALHLPNGVASAFVLFAHCFTCGKDSAAAARIARALAAQGFAVLRFDFTGLGGSEGDFENTDFSANVADLRAAADWLRAEHRAPQLLVGHSLGGTAVLAAAADVPECRAIATIGAPADPSHVIGQFAAQREQILAQGRAEVSLGGRPFTIRREFIEDLESQPLSARLPHLRRALLVFHAPLDNVVSIDEASRLFEAARHPKSFVSLDDADHLLGRRSDAEYVGATLAAWAARYVEAADTDRPAIRPARGSVRVDELDQAFLRRVVTDDHDWRADEPLAAGGGNAGPDPYEHLLAALGTCTSMTVRLYAGRKDWPLEDVEVELEHSRDHVTDCEGCEAQPQRIDVLHRRIRLRGALDAGQRARLLEIADRCPVHRTLEGPLRITTEAVET